MKTKSNLKRYVSTFFRNFLRCGLIGWCLECFWTGLGALKRRDKYLTCRTSVLMFPIYGMAALIAPFSRLCRKRNVLLRGSLYAMLIFIAEYLSGSYLQKKDACPWDYSAAKCNIKGRIRLDYAPLWFVVGLLYEKILSV